jgi:hydrogenase maturation protein HypF
MRMTAARAGRARRALQVRGTVQGVGFRPGVYRLAESLALGGFVRNDAEGVSIEVEGSLEDIERFVVELPRSSPLARIDSVDARPLPSRGDTEFEIAASGAGAGRGARIPADLGPCPDCLRELADPGDRRHRHPFINCTACGPRYSIVEAVPYDRAQTTMARFTLCAACRREYLDPGDRRFHAEPNACPTCGPKLRFARAPGADIWGRAALTAAVAVLGEGGVLAVKGAGGFVLATDARDVAAVARLRQRKRRPDKPLAVMVRDLAELERIAVLDGPARAALTSPARPIVLVPLRPEAGLAPAVAPGLREVGAFLPATPLQHLLLADGPPAQVMTSGNLADEPIARDDGEARRRLATVADAFLLHDRVIHTRLDDSVVRVIGGQPVPLRRARGFVPEPIALPVKGPPVLAVGGETKATVCLAAGGEAVLSQHLGDLTDPDAFAFFEETIRKLIRLTGLTPVAVAHDLHPDYRSTRWAKARGLPLLPVQHHHAHAAACLADNGHDGPALAVVLDGTGLGSDGGAWGGELMLVDRGSCRRLGHLRPLRLPGGEAAIRAPWRLAASALLDAGEPLDLLGAQAETIREVWARPRLSPSATGAGRWFDAVAALCGLRQEVSYDGQAAVELEAVAAEGDHLPYPFTLDEPCHPFVIDLRPTIQAIAADRRAQVPAALVSARFHETLALAVTTACACAVGRGAPEVVALSGGCFANRRLTERVSAMLAQCGMRVLRHQRVPPNDGGLALGQALVASHQLAATEAPCA